jgi:hypothetical protein
MAHMKTMPKKDMVNANIEVYNYRMVPVGTMDYSWGTIERGPWGVK